MLPALFYSKNINFFQKTSLQVITYNQVKREAIKQITNKEDTVMTDEIKAIVDGYITKAQYLADNDYHFNTTGMNRSAWYNKETGKIYVTCRTLNGRVVKSYKMGKVDLETGEYTSSKWDDANMEDFECPGEAVEETVEETAEKKAYKVVNKWLESGTEDIKEFNTLEEAMGFAEGALFLANSCKHEDVSLYVVDPNGYIYKKFL